MAMMISWVMPVNPSHPYLENDPAPSFAPTICAFHLGLSLGTLMGYGVVAALAALLTAPLSWVPVKIWQTWEEKQNAETEIAPN